MNIRTGKQAFFSDRNRPAVNKHQKNASSALTQSVSSNFLRDGLTASSLVAVRDGDNEAGKQTPKTKLKRIRPCAVMLPRRG